MTSRAMIHVGSDVEAARRAFEEHGVRELMPYREAVLVEGEDEAVEALRARGFTVREWSRSEKTPMRGFVLDPGAAPAEAAAFVAGGRENTAAAAPDLDAAEPGRYLLQLIGPLHPAWRQKLETLGIEIHESVTRDTYLISAPPSAVPVLEQHPAVEAVSGYRPPLKIAPQLLDTALQQELVADEAALVAQDLQQSDSMLSAEPDTEPEHGNCEIVLFAEDARPQVVTALQDLGVPIFAERPRVLNVFLRPHQVAAVAALEGVRKINSDGPAVLHNPVAARIVGAVAVQQQHGLDGTGEIVAVADSGLDSGVDDGTLLADFTGRVVSFHALGRPGDASDLLNHGTHVAGTIVGTGASSNGRVRGLAPGARLVFQSLATGDRRLIEPDDLAADLFARARDDGATLHNNSWGNESTNGSYTTRAEEVDRFAFENRESLILFSAGNDNPSLVTSPGTAKNALTVGASKSERQLPDHVVFDQVFPARSRHFTEEADDPDQLFDESCGGPVDNGRRKPDVVAPGTFILSTRSTVSTGNYGQDGIPESGDESTHAFTRAQAVGKGLPGGPFFGSGNQNTPAMPAGSGAGAEEFYCYDSGTSMATPVVTGCCALLRQFLRQQGHQPSAALLKALIVSGARRLQGVPEERQGWGRVDLSSSLPIPNSGIHFDDHLPHAAAAGDTRTYVFSALDLARPITATLVWRDPPGEAIQNRLHLELMTPSGQRLEDDPVEAVRNNVQKVILANPESGVYQVTVTAENIADGIAEFEGSLRQDYALVVTNVDELVPTF